MDKRRNIRFRRALAATLEDALRVESRVIIDRVYCTVSFEGFLPALSIGPGPGKFVCCRRSVSIGGVRIGEEKGSPVACGQSLVATRHVMALSYAASAMSILGQVRRDQSQHMTRLSRVVVGHNPWSHLSLPDSDQTLPRSSFKPPLSARRPCCRVLQKSDLKLGLDRGYVDRTSTYVCIRTVRLGHVCEF